MAHPGYCAVHAANATRKSKRYPVRHMRRIRMQLEKNQNCSAGRNEERINDRNLPVMQTSQVNHTETENGNVVAKRMPDVSILPAYQVLHSKKISWLCTYSSHAQDAHHGVSCSMCHCTSSEVRFGLPIYRFF